MFDRKTYFDHVRDDPFPDELSEDQVNGQEAILSVWENIPFLFPGLKLDLRWLAYMLATTFHETGQTMQPIEEWGKGEGHDYGVPDEETGQTYFGRGFVQLTWRSNYARATQELGIPPQSEEDLEWHATMALRPDIAAKVMFKGMYQGWFRGDSEGPHTLPRYFNDTVDDPYNARDIINGDVSKNGKMIEGYHDAFLLALEAAEQAEPSPRPEPEGIPLIMSTLKAMGREVLVQIDPVSGQVEVWVDGELIVS